MVRDFPLCDLRRSRHVEGWSWNPSGLRAGLKELTVVLISRVSAFTVEKSLGAVDACSDYRVARVASAPGVLAFFYTNASSAMVLQALADRRLNRLNATLAR
jgi:hypothetical protein